MITVAKGVDIGILPPHTIIESSIMLRRRPVAGDLLKGKAYTVGGDGFETHLRASGKMIDGKPHYFLSVMHCEAGEDPYEDYNWCMVESLTFTTVKNLCDYVGGYY